MDELTCPQSWNKSQCQRAKTQGAIAEELGFNQQAILQRLIQHGGPFPTAGELIDALYEEPQSEIPSQPYSRKRLELETLHLMKKATCALCKMNPSSVVLLPCSERTLCTHCIKRTSVCPRCKTPIETTIQTFL